MPGALLRRGVDPRMFSGIGLDAPVRFSGPMMRSTMHHRHALWIFSAVGLALCLAAPSEAAKVKRKKSPAAHTMHYRHSSAAPYYARGVPAGPLYNGADYLGTDPAP